MPKFYRHSLRQIQPPDVALAGLRGGRAANSARVHAVFSALDRIPATSRRVVCSSSAGDGQLWAEDNAVQRWITGKTITRSKFDLTPGCMLSMVVVYLNGGETATSSTADTPPFCRLDVEVDWTDESGGTVAQTYPLQLQVEEDPPSNLWQGFRTARLNILHPSLWRLDDPESIRDYSKNTHVELKVLKFGGARIVDLVISEVPQDVAFADSEPTETVSGAFAPGDPTGPFPDLRSPYERLNTTDNPRGGTRMALDQARHQLRRMGPMMFSWSAYHQATDTDLEGENDFFTTSTIGRWQAFPLALGTSAAGQPPSNIAEYVPLGVSFGHGGYCVRPEDRIGERRSVPVRIWVALDFQSSDTDRGYNFRFETTPWSHVTTTWMNQGAGTHWYTTYGHLEVGQGPGDDVRFHMFNQKISGGGFYAVRIRAVVVHRADQYELPSGVL